jgi:hypothetical protein
MTNDSIFGNLSQAFPDAFDGELIEALCDGQVDDLHRRRQLLARRGEMLLVDRFADEWPEVKARLRASARQVGPRAVDLAKRKARGALRLLGRAAFHVRRGMEEALADEQKDLNDIWSNYQRSRESAWRHTCRM